jgi:predicted amidohydrolase YtcJ
MRVIRSVAAAVVTGLCVLAALPASAQVTVLTAQRIDTMDPAHPRAQAMAYDAQGKVLQLGDREAVLQAYPGATRLDVGDATVVPGMIDAHGHLLGQGLTHLTANLVGTTSKAEVIERLRAFEATLPEGEWLVGNGWDQNDWTDKTFPTAADLDAAFPRRPVWLDRIDGHAGWANTAAMRAVGRDLSGDWQPDGGRIVRDAGGAATGIFVDGAMGLVSGVIPALDAGDIEQALKLAMQDAVSNGLTGVHDAGVSLGTLRVMQSLADAGDLPIRITAMAAGDDEALA